MTRTLFWLNQRRFHSLLGGLIVSSLLLSCAGKQAVQDPEHVAEIEEWRSQRDIGLRKDDGWLTLVALHWLDEGKTSFGSDPSLSLVLPEGKAPATAGVFEVTESGVRITPAEGVEITHGGEIIGEMMLQSDLDTNTTYLELGPLLFNVIDRGGRLAVRVKDRESQALTQFAGMDSYPIDGEWRISARFEPYDPPKTVTIPNITGTSSDAESPGAIVFEVEGEIQRLDVLDAGDAYWIIFGDATNGKETYVGGRFLYTESLADDGVVVVDFNKTYNPPCVFTAFATCPLPTKENRLAISVSAGERMYDSGH